MPDDKLKIKDLPLEERPRERLIREGPKALSSAELLAIILRTGGKKESVLNLSQRLLNKYDLKKLSRINTMVRSLLSKLKPKPATSHGILWPRVPMPRLLYVRKVC